MLIFSSTDITERNDSISAKPQSRNYTLGTIVVDVANCLVTPILFPFCIPVLYVRSSPACTLVIVLPLYSLDSSSSWLPKLCCSFLLRETAKRILWRPLLVLEPWSLERWLDTLAVARPRKMWLNRGLQAGRQEESIPTPSSTVESSVVSMSAPK